MKRIVVGVDGSIGSALAVSWAVDECKLRGATLLIAHCPDLRDARTTAIRAEAGMRAVDRRAEQILTSFSHAASTRQPSVPVSSLISHSDAYNALIDLSEGSELLVLGSNGSGILDHAVSRRAGAVAHCPVLVVPVAGGESTGVVSAVVHVAVDDPSDECALRFAVQEAAFRGVPLHSVSWSPSLEVRGTDQLTVVGRGTVPGPWVTRPAGPAGRLLDRLQGPLVVVGPDSDVRSDSTSGRDQASETEFCEP